jgi:acetylornithine deacetylase/succinyl-diaminopimelate desuccinylase-like protein
MHLYIYCILQVTIQGSQGHAGTVPMNLRKDPMPAAAQSIVAIEQLCTHSEKASGGSHGTSTMSTAANSAGNMFVQLEKFIHGLGLAMSFQER